MLSDLDSLLARTDLNASTLPSYLEILFSAYPNLGQLVKYVPIPIGYEDANFILNTSTGKYVLKVIANDMSLGNIRGHVQVLTEAKKIGVPVPELIANSTGNFLTHIGTTDCFITRFFDGQKMESPSPDLDDIRAMTMFVTKLNTLNFPLFVSYDSWGNRNLMIEFKRDREKVNPAVIDFIKPVTDEFRTLDLHGARQGVIHGDIQRKHIIKNSAGEYCLIDFGVARLDYLIYELSTYLAWFCLNPHNWSEHNKIIDTVVSIYTQTHSLSNQELKFLPLLIQATYAIYYFRTAVLLSEGNSSQETLDWHNLAQTMLQLSQQI